MADAQILCTRCGAASAEPRLECAKCGGRNSRVCGGCGNQNSVAKNFCDKCGQSIAQLGRIAPPAGAQPAGSSANVIPATAIRNSPSAQPAAPGASEPKVPLPLAGKSAIGPASAPLDDLWSAPAPLRAAEPPRSRRRSAWRPLLNALAALAGIAGAAYGIWDWRENHVPEFLVPKLAARYLESLRTREYAGAYALFSDDAKKACTEDEFRSSRRESPWTWSGLVIERQEDKAILLAYELKPDDAPKRRDHLLFIREGKRWVRPYNGTLMRQVEDFFEKGNVAQGTALALQAATINTRDPMAWGYLCEAAYFRKSPSETEARCERALDLARSYPSGMTLRSLYHLHALLADTYAHGLALPDRALDQYTEMLAFPGLSPADQCTLLLARSQAYAAISRPGEALSDIERGAQLCFDPRDRATIHRMRESLRAPDSP